MRVCVIGNCQVFGLAAAIPSLRADARVRAVFCAEFEDSSLTAGLVSAIEAADLVLNQPGDWEIPEPIQQALDSRVGNTIEWPILGFTGFQPDQNYLYHNGKVIRSAQDAYNSTIVTTCHAAGYSREETLSRFNSLSYARLGYFDEFAKATQINIDRFEKFDMDFEAMLEKWIPLDCFMNTINHPKIAVLADVAEACFAKAGIRTKRDGSPLPLDPLGDCIGPVYPEIARRLGIAGGFEFLVGLGKEPIALEAFIAGSYELYNRLEPGVLSNQPRIREAAAALGIELEGEATVERRRGQLRLERALRPAYPMGQLIDCADPKQSLPYLEEGWSGPETGLGRWSCGPAAQMVLVTDPVVDSPLVLRLRASPFLQPSRPSLGVQVELNGSVVTDWTLTGDQPGFWAELSAPLPTGICDDGDLTFTFRFDSCVSPSKLGLSGDTRELGILLQSFVLEPAPD